MTKYKYIIFLSIAISIGLSSCRFLRPSDMFKTPKELPVNSFDSTKYTYLLKPFDKISVRVSSNLGETFYSNLNNNVDNATYQRNRLGYEFAIEYDGSIKLPLIGRVIISNLTVRQAEDFLETKFKDYIVDPIVLIQVTNRKVMIFMESGTKAQIVQMPTENLTLIEALAQTGGITEMSKSYRIKLIRGDITKTPEVYYWNISTLADLKNSNIYLEANDIIYVDSRPRYVHRVMRDLTPYLSLLTTLLTIYGLFIKNSK